MLVFTHGQVFQTDIRINTQEFAFSSKPVTQSVYYYKLVYLSSLK